MASNAKRIRAMLENYLEARKEGPAVGDYEIRNVTPDNYEHFYVLIKPLAGPYKGHKYVLELKTTYGKDSDTMQYPDYAPYIHFITNILHVNISPGGGAICLDILKDKDKWSPLNSIDTVIRCIMLLMNEPNNSSPWNGEASRQWVECEKIYKQRMRPSMPEEAREGLYNECFQSFIANATAATAGNNLKQYSKWFAELDPQSNNYEAALAKEKEDFINLMETYEAMKVKKIKPKTTKAVGQTEKEATTADDKQLDDKNEQPDDKKPDDKKPDDKKDKKPPRWAKYQQK